MSGSKALPEDKQERHPHKKRTLFTEKQLEDLTLIFNRNPYPDPNLRRQMASKMNLDPSVLQVWFKNHRAKLKKQKLHVQQKQEVPQRESAEPQAPQRESAEPQAKAGPTWSRAVAAPREPELGPCLAAPVYTNRQTPSFQLSICPPFKIHTVHAGSHKMIHFGCCRDPTVYFLQQISEPPPCTPGCTVAHHHSSVPHHHSSVPSREAT
ncbi:divergent paired-related homeobox [Marmota marmota marmota]|uniref:divergent paired-related homeobox n=1 Tax=Marmota marmota marmota TaxID=9994 RepID=UPI0007627511|nr:divergent paired-related homeobox [Marmota marmota marmota]